MIAVAEMIMFISKFYETTDKVKLLCTFFVET